MKKQKERRTNSLSKIIIHNGRCGSTYLYLVLDRYYRAREGDDSIGSFDSIYERKYDLENKKYVGLNEFLVPEVIESVFYNERLIVWSPGRQKARGKEHKRGALHNVMYTTMGKDDFTKQTRRMVVSSILDNQTLLLKYPLLTNPKPEWNVDYISCERRDVRKQTKSLYLSMTTGHYHFGPDDDKKIQKLKKFGPRPDTLDRWTQDMERSWEVYRALKPKRCQTVFMEDFEDLKPFEVLEMIGIMDWSKYLDKGFDVPIRKAWHR